MYVLLYSCDMTEGGDAQTRDGFSGKRGFILASIGSAVGMGNIWRFPAMVSLWGGLTFIIPYLIFVVLISATGVIGEFALGRAAKAGPCWAFGMCTERRFGNRKVGERIGLVPVIGSLALAIGYTCVVAWIIKYTVMAFDGDLFAMGQDMDVITGMFNNTASAWGANMWVVVAAVATLLIMSLGVSKGIEKANNILMPLLFTLLIGLAMYVATLPGASAGYSYILTIDMDLLANPLVWIFAFGQAFFSLSVAGNGSVIYGSYFKRNESIPSAAFYVAFFDTVSALLAAMVIIPAMAAGGAELNEGGPGLMFVYIVNVFNGMDGGYIVGIVFFVSVLFAGMASIVNLYEAPVSFLQERFGAGRVKATLTMVVIGGAVALCIQSIVSPWMDGVSIYICPLGALLAAVMLFWVAGKDFAEREASEGAKKPIGKWFVPLGKYAYCALSLIALVAGALLGGIG